MPEAQFTFSADHLDFTVDTEKRTISGQIVPFGVKPIDGRNVTFSKGDIAWSNFKSVKMNLDHAISTSFGFGLSLAEGDTGIHGSFKVADGPRGDEALTLAESGVYDGLSVSLYKPEGKDKYHLAHVALTAEPAFDSARVTSIAASAASNKEGAVMADNTETAEAPQDFSAVTTAITEGFAALTVPPREVTPAGEGVTREESPYRFNGTRGAHEFSTDLFAGTKGSGESMQRVQDFIQHTFAAVDSGDVTSVNPNGFRPDLYVDYIEKDAPVYAAINSGGLSGPTPYVVPKFASSSNEVADHAEGVEPANDVTFVTDDDTVTPAALSGRAVITRKVYDAGGNPQVSAMIWRQMNRKYAELLETKAAAFMNSLTLTELGGTLTTGATDATLAKLVKAGLVGAQFIDGSGSWDFFTGHRDLYTALATAVDGDDRPYFPVVNAVNADGTAGGKFRSLDIGGHNLLPAGTLGASGVNQKSFIGDKEGLHFVNTAPQRIDLAETVATVSFGLYGYWAAALLDGNKVRKLTYDNAA
ncbi:hypothetical protein [Nocardioides sp. NPDC006273]|uniref:hypothetical protein n=1 Tax=Nocardioides sp. NPDC006273 TaxID=3155598 RepID=UPI0033A79C99